MATLISAHRLSKSFASKKLFQDISFAIDENEQIGLIGPNGAGKSTLMKLMTRSLTPDSGQLSFSNNLVLGYLEQKPIFNDDLSIYETLINCTSDIYDNKNIQLAYELISKLQIDQLAEGAESKISSLSGGWQKKVALARELMKRPNLLLLDEPTNHLDLDSILWLEEFVKKTTDCAFLIITHDRRFLQNACRVIFDLDSQLPQGLLRTNGAYTTHLENKMQLLEGQKRLEEKRRNTMTREKEWLARGPQARLTKQKARIDRAYDLIDEVENLENKNYKKSLALDFGNTAKSPKKLIEAQQISKSYGAKNLFQNFSVMIRPGHRYGLIGSNGSGKSTLLKCLIGQIKVDSGIVQVNEDIDISYFEQGKDQIDLKKSVLKSVCPEGDYVHFQGQAVFARSYLSRFHFNSQQMDMPAAQLSGGELSRLIIARMMLKSSHVLILDEPTNDLDVDTLESLTDCLSEYQGALILVSHDRYFMDQNCDVIWAFDEQSHQVVTFADTLQWESWFKETQIRNKSSSAKQQKSGSTRQGLSYKEKLEFEKMESVIQEHETQLADLQNQLSSANTQADFNKLNQISKSISEVEKKIERLFSRWEELTEKNKVAK